MVCQRELEVELLHATQHLDPLRFSVSLVVASCKNNREGLAGVGSGWPNPSLSTVGPSLLARADGVIE